MTFNGNGGDNGQNFDTPGYVIRTCPNVPVVLVRNLCPHCHNGVLEDDYGFCALCLAIVFFPLGIVCCMLMKDRVCPSCGSRF